MNQIEPTKKCSKCQEVKPVTEFHKRPDRKCGYRSKCKLCEKKISKQWWENNPEKIKEYAKSWRENNPEQRKLINKKYRLNKPENVKKSHDKWVLKNTDYQKNRRINNKEYFQIYEKTRYRNDINYRLKKNIRSRISHAIKNNSKSDHTQKLLGCNIDQFKSYLQSLFTEGMSWDNYGNKERQWSIDHIIPCDHFDLSDPIEQQRCFHYSNCQPLWHIDNIKKNNKIIQ